MSKIQILDCTLRDGGYTNNWQFGRQAILDIKKALEDIGVKFIELGFLREEEYEENRAIYNSIENISHMIGEKREGTIYGTFIEVANYFPLEKLENRTEKAPEALRCSLWKRALDDAYEYFTQIKKKGYLLCCQPTRIEQYSEKEFGELCKRFSELHPYSIYIVDTFGVLDKEALIRYAQIADENMAPDIILGYHAHDNMGQAFRNACAFVEQDYGNRIIQLDASMFGMGRGAGNLRLEQILEYLNRQFGENYDLTPIYKIWDQYLCDALEEHPWGYQLAYFIAAQNACHPNYASYYLRRGLKAEVISRIISQIRGADKYLYSDIKAEQYIRCSEEITQ